MSYFLQYIHGKGDNDCLTLINDIPEFSLINGNPLLNYIFKEDKLYYITFSVKSKSVPQTFKIELVDLKDDRTFEESQKQLIKSFTMSADNNQILKGFSCIFSPYFQSFNGLVWSLESENNQSLVLSDVKIYQLNQINFFENKQDSLIRQITKISILGKPNTHVAINGNDLQIGINENLELPQNFIVTSIGVASTDNFIINLMYQIL